MTDAMPAAVSRMPVRSAAGAESPVARLLISPRFFVVTVAAEVAAVVSVTADAVVRTGSVVVAAVVVVTAVVSAGVTAS